jgi:hypothetical protein
MRLVMRAAAVAALCALGALLFTLSLPAAPAYAGGYGFGVHGPGYVWYSSSCCYRRVVRHERGVFYVRAGAFVPDDVVVAPAPRALYVEPVVRHREVQFSEFDTYWNDREFGLAGCYWREAPVNVAPGAWFWGRKFACY